MLRINLLPSEKRQSRILFWPAAVMVMVFAAIIIAGMLIGSGNKYWQVEQEFAELHNRYQLLKPVEGKMQIVSDKHMLLDRRADVLLSLTKERLSWTALIANLAAIAPANVWYTNIGIVTGGSEPTPQASPGTNLPVNTGNQLASANPANSQAVINNRVSVSGVAIDYNAVAELLSGMENYEQLKNSELVGAFENSDAKGVLFEIIIDVP